MLCTGIAFSGWADINKAISDSSALFGRLPGTKYISIGGGLDTGRWTASVLNSLVSAINQGRFGSWAGIVFDIELGDAGLAGGFANAFAVAKARGLRVIVTVSHSAPYDIPDAAPLMRSILANPNVDIISPQLYSTGSEGANDYATSMGVQWSEYAGARARIAPGLVYGSYYAAAQTFFRNQGVTLSGYIQWH